jgi:putative DNA-invertase from lambdoid prophage Rac
VLSRSIIGKSAPILAEIMIRKSQINSAYAEFERDIIRDRVIAGIKAKREKTGVWGRKEVKSDIQIHIRELINQGISIRRVAKTLHVAKGTVQKYMKQTVVR